MNRYLLQLFLFWALTCSGTGLAAAPLKIPSNPLLALEQQVRLREKLTPGLVKGSEAHFYFRDLDNPAPTKRAILYVHGFSASPPEVSPLIENLSTRYNANAFFARLSGHGFEGHDAMTGVTLEHWKAEVAASFKIARQLGEKVLVVGSSTGATLAVLEALKDSSQLEALVLMSPNFGLGRSGEKLLLLPYGLGWLAGRLVLGPYRCFQPLNARQALYWTPCYPFTALIEMVRAIEEAKTSPLAELRAPVLTLYSEKDKALDLAALKATHARFGSAKKQLTEITGAENDHVLAGDILSPSGTAEIEKAIDTFLSGK